MTTIKGSADTGHNDKFGIPIYDGDELVQECRMVDDYTGKESIEYQKLIVRFDNTKKVWSVYCPSAPNKEDWGYIPKSAYKVAKSDAQPVKEVTAPLSDKSDVEEPFIEYVTNERRMITNALSNGWLDKSPAERVAIENLLIAYDQMAERIQGATDQEKLMHGEWVKVSEVEAALNGLLDNGSIEYILTLLRDKQQ